MNSRFGRIHTLGLMAALIAGSVFGGAASAEAQAQPVAQLLLKFEQAVKWEAVEESWRTDRPGWVQRVNAATTVAQVAAALRDLELATKWEAVNDSWRTDRPAWVQAVGALAGR